MGSGIFDKEKPKDTGEDESWEAEAQVFFQVAAASEFSRLKAKLKEQAKPPTRFQRILRSIRAQFKRLFSRSH